ncbi:MAG: response regulator [Planctomycetota bacterium]|jgi:DNA-binding NarL/FixJ family response regulator
MMIRTRTKILCVDDHAFLVEGLRARLALEADLEFVGHLERADHLVEEVRRREADVVLLDIEMPGTEPFEALQDLARQCPDTKAIILSAFVRDHYIDAAYQAGAWGYLCKSDPPETVIDGIRRVVRGELAASEEVLKRAQPPAGRNRRAARQMVRSKLELLTDRETQILRMIARGMSRVDIARETSRSPMTIDNHRKSIMKKVGIHDRAELVRYAIAEGLVEV